MTLNKKAGKSSKNNSAEVQTNRGIPIHKGWGVLMLFVCVSVAYANYVVFMGTDGYIPKVMLIPSTLFVAAFLVHKAAK